MTLWDIKDMSIIVYDLDTDYVDWINMFYSRG